MKFSLVIEAIDKASKAVRGISNAQKAANAESVRGAEKAARASEKAAKSMNRQGQAADKTAKAIHRTAQATEKSNRTAQKAERLLNSRLRGWRTETNAVERLNKVTARWQRLQANRASQGMLGMLSGAGKIRGGVKSIASYGALLGGFAGLSGAGVSALFIKPAKQYSDLKTQLQKVTKSAAETDAALQWVAARQMPPHGIMNLTAAFVALKTSGIDPTKNALQTAADAAIANSKGIEDVADAMTAAFKGDFAALQDYGVEAKKSGKYIAYVFKDADGRMKRIRALAKSNGAQAAAMSEIFRRMHGGASDRYGKTWDGMLWRVGDVFDRLRIKIMSGGLYDFLQEKLSFILTELDKLVIKIDQWATDGTLDRWARNISDNLGRALRIGWAVAKGFYRAGKMIFGALDIMAGYVGGWENLAMIMIALPVVPALLQIAAGVFAVSKGFITLLGVGKTIIGLFIRLKGLSALGAVFRLLLAPIGLVTRAFVAMGIAIMTTPVGWIMAGIATIAGGAYLIYKNWDRLGPWFADIFAGIKGIFSDALGGIVAMFEGAIAKIKNVLSSGVALMRTFADGIRSGSGVAIAATRDVVGKIRDYLPHSPAKVGPLSDLDKVRFSETLATAMRPGPAVKAAERMASQVRNALSGPMSAQVSRPLSAGLASGGSASVSIQFAPVITVNGGDRTSVEMAIREAYSRFKAELPKLMDEAARRKARTAY